MHQSFVTTAPHLRGKDGDTLLKCRAITFRVSSQYKGNDRVLTVSLPQGDFLLQRMGRRTVFTSSLPPGGWGL